MKHKMVFLKFLMCMLFTVQFISAQQPLPNDHGMGTNEKAPVIQQEKLPASVLERLNNFSESSGEDAKMELNREVDMLLGAETPEDVFGITKTSAFTSNFNSPPFTPDWYTTDVQIHSGPVASVGGFKQLDLCQGEDGKMYMVVNRAGTPGQLAIYISTNGGATWPAVINYNAGSGYIHNISALVESRNNSIPDSTRILVYFTFGSVINGDNASLYVLNVKSNGTGGIVYPVGNPSGGNKFEYVTSCSDGMYYQVSTYMHAVVREATNAGVQVGIRHFRSTTWGVSHSSALISTGYNDYYPASAFSVEAGVDSIYIAVERRISTTEYELRMLVTPEAPSVNYRVFYITSAVSGTKYEKPAITIVQQSAGVPKKVLVTCTRNRNPRYNYSSDGGGTWVIDQLLGPNTSQVADYTTCSSDSLTSGGQYVIAGYVTDNGDSVNVKQGSIPGGFPFVYYKKNQHQSSGVVAPVCAIYRPATIKYAAFGYPGFGPSSVYYNAEQLVTGIQPVGSSIPEKFELKQNYPNPFNPETNISFSVPHPGSVKLAVFDLLGREVAVLVNEDLKAGVYKVNFNASVLSTGVYFYRIETNGFSEVKKMMLVK
ncbi:MAG: T9SS type A sorting domain-containing protein [Ignavibacteria bacterium]|nr:T9SS type A sorting domain-containing protein [Ignavibacteria bacterium]